LESTVNGIDVRLRTTFKDGSATTEGTEAGKPVTRTDVVSPQTLVLPDFFFGAYEAVSRRLATAVVGDELRAYRALLGEVAFRVRSVSADRMQTGISTFNIRRYDLVIVGADSEQTANLSVDENGTFIRLVLPAQAIDVVRDDIVSSTSRTQVYSNPGDEAVIVPGAGFNIGATLTRPKGRTGRLPAVVVLTGSSIGDRDGYVAGVPILGQMAGALADAGFLAIRYDKRGTGQSGGRAESATLQDFAEDARAVVKWLSGRRDIDPKRIAVLGYGDGAWVALLAASRDKRIAAVVSVAAPAVSGPELILEQQQRALTRMNASESERTAKIDLQKRIHNAVLTGRGWEGVPPEVRKQADTPLFQSILSFDPTRVLDDVRQPLLLTHGELDREVPLAHVQRMAEIARKVRKSKVVDVITVPGVNHLLTSAATGEEAEYAVLKDRTVSGDVMRPITAWLTKTLALPSKP
jgi:dienelactone hydrolase